MPHDCCLYGLPQGTCARVRSLDGCGEIRTRLHAMGFTPGAEVVLCGAGAGGCRVRVRDALYVLDEGVAQAIMCDPIPSQSVTRKTPSARGKHA